MPVLLNITKINIFVDKFICNINFDALVSNCLSVRFTPVTVVGPQWLLGVYRTADVYTPRIVHTVCR